MPVGSTVDREIENRATVVWTLVRFLDSKGVRLGEVLRWGPDEWAVVARVALRADGYVPSDLTRGQVLGVLMERARVEAV